MALCRSCCCDQQGNAYIGISGLFNFYLLIIERSYHPGHYPGILCIPTPTTETLAQSFSIV